MTTQPGTPRRLKIFLCHASGDKPAVRDLHHRLRAAGFAPWLDEEQLLPGQDWQIEIPQAVRASDAVVICLSRRAVTKAGYVQKEIRYALDAADEQPEGAIFLIPLRLEECEVPYRLRQWHWVNLFHEQGFERLLRALRARAQSLGLPTYTFEPKMILVPTGEFLMGSDPGKDEFAEDWEQPQHTLYLPDFFIARTPVTNAQYAPFAEAAFRHPADWAGREVPPGKEDHPVVYVSGHDAAAFCNWLADVTDRPYRLPSEAEWEKAARGTDGRIYPWGDAWNFERCNSREGGRWDTTPVEAYPKGASPYGVLDMSGNVWEWTRSLHMDYPYDPEDGREQLLPDDVQVLRGGAWNSNPWLARCACRATAPATDVSLDLGFRVVLPVSPAHPGRNNTRPP